MEIQIKSNQIYLQAQNIKENEYDKHKVEQMGTTSTNGSASTNRTQRQRNCSNMSPSKKKKFKQNIKNYMQLTTRNPK